LDIANALATLCPFFKFGIDILYESASSEWFRTSNVVVNCRRVTSSVMLRLRLRHLMANEDNTAAEALVHMYFALNISCWRMTRFRAVEITAQLSKHLTDWLVIRCWQFEGPA